MSYLISFIIPVYNRKHILPRAINSILNSNFNDYEIILVDDGSVDGSAELCKQYESDDTRFKAICLTENHGPGNARNKGIEIASGKWIYFLDSDDEIITSSLEIVANKLYNLDENVSLIAIDSIWIQTNSDGTEKLYMPKSFERDGLYESQEFFKRYPSLMGVQIWNYIFSREFLIENKIKFLSLYLYEDTIFQSKASIFADKVYVFADVFVKYYKLNIDSLTLQTTKIYKYEDLNLFVKPLIEYCRQYVYATDNIKSALYKRMFNYVLFFGIQFDLEFKKQNKDSLYYINQLANCENIGNQNNMFEKLFSVFYNGLLNESIYIVPAGRVQRILAKRLNADGGQVLGLFDNHLGTLKGRIFDDLSNIKVYSLEYLDYVDKNIKFINIGSGKLSQILKNQFKKYGVELL